MNDRTRARSRSIMAVCACLVLAGIIAIVWGVHRPMPSQSIPLPAAASSSASNTPPPSSPPATAAPKASAVSAPATVQIPSIREGSDLLKLGTTSEGALQVPDQSHANQAGWFTGSPKPGQDGPAVILGHVISNAGPAVFYKLAYVKVGQDVRVTNTAGKVLVFTVYRVASYPKNSFPTNEVYGNTPGPELRVITCGGIFNSHTGHYLNNTVLYARLTS